MDTKDLEALQLALKLTLEEQDDGRVEQVRSMLADRSRSWFDTASFCAYHQQIKALQLEPWDDPPMCAEPDTYPHTQEAGQLLGRMLRAGVSRYHPDPLAALEAEEARKQTAR